MTNEEKARELQLDCIRNGCGDSTDIRCACEEMAKWKDQQYVEIIKDECNNSYESGLCEGRRMAEKKFKECLEKKRHTELVLSIANAEDSEIWNRHDGKYEILGEIINELFKEEK